GGGSGPNAEQPRAGAGGDRAGAADLAPSAGDSVRRRLPPADARAPLGPRLPARLGPLLRAGAKAARRRADLSVRATALLDRPRRSAGRRAGSEAARRAAK